MIRSPTGRQLLGELDDVAVGVTDVRARRPRSRCQWPSSGATAWRELARRRPRGAVAGVYGWSPRSAAALALAFPEPGLWWWAYVGVVPVLVMVSTAPDGRASTASSPRRAAGVRPGTDGHHHLGIVWRCP